MSNYVSIHSKYYNNSKSTGLLAHIDRTFKENKNVLHSDLPNFGNNVTEQYNELLKQAIESKGKAFRKDSNLYIDSVVSFSREQTEYLIEKYGFERFKIGITKAFNVFQNKMKDEYGLTPCGFNFHMDEGHYDDDNNLIRNYHAHCVFLNYDFKSKKQPWRTLKPKDFSNFQDIAGESFKKAGYVRGTSKEETKKKHLEKEEFILFKNKEKELEELKKQQELDLKKITFEYIELEKKHDILINENEKLIKENNILKDTVKKLNNTISKLKLKFNKILEMLKYSKNKQEEEAQKEIEKLIDYKYSTEEAFEKNESNIEVEKTINNKNRKKRKFTF